MKKFRAPLRVLACAPFVLVALLTWLVSLLLYIPFTYEQFLKGGVFPSLNWFLRAQPWLYWGSFALAAIARGRAAAAVFAGPGVAAGAFLTLRPLSAMPSGGPALLASFAALVPLAALGIADCAAGLRAIAWSRERYSEDRRIFGAAWNSALFVAGVYAAMAIYRGSLGFGTDSAAACAWTLASHLAAFAVLFALAQAIRGGSEFFRGPARAAFVLLYLCGAAGLAVALNQIGFRPVSFTGLEAAVAAGAVALALGVCAAGCGVRLWTPDCGAVTGTELALAPIGSLVARSPRAAWPALAVVAGAAFFITGRAARMDWNYLLQKSTALVVWALAFTCFYAMAPRRAAPRDRSRWMLAAALLAVAAYRLMGFAPTGPLEHYAGFDPSFRLIHEALARPAGSTSIYRFLERNTNISREVHIDPVEVNLADLTPAAGQRPHIFVFVIDSLRPDYLGAYNPRVTFTPAIDSFARESVVFRKAFTRYGGSGLSEPSLWAGSLLIHQQYPRPFYPMNALEKLLLADGYHSYVSLDSILHTIVKPDAGIEELDAGVPNMKYDLCRTLDELKGKLAARPVSTAPVFAYSMPQNIHVSVIQREHASVPAGESYPGFYAPCAARVRRMDGCFGGFLQFLRAAGWYDESVIILTADHGDSLGEDGRWGHAYTLFPEIVRVPLIVHLPSALRNLISHANEPAFLSDITPSLYYLLGHRPVARNPLFGRPLFAASGEELKAPAGERYIAASSYAAVYGVLDRSAESYYLLDAVNRAAYFYELRPDGSAVLKGRRLKPDLDRFLEDRVRAIARFYRYRAGEDGGLR